MVLGKQHMEERDHIINKNVIPNAFKYSSPGEGFWIDCVDLLPEYKYFKNGNPTPPEIATGPIFLFECLDRLKPENMKILDPEIFYPISWDIDGSAASDSISKSWLEDPEGCFPEAFAVTYWTCSWRDQSCVHQDSGANQESASKLNQKQKEFIKLKDKWADFVDMESFKFIESQIPYSTLNKKDFDCFNPGCKIAIVSLYTDEIASFGTYSEKSIKDYCIKQNYTFYVYRKKLDGNASPNWSKAQAILNHIKDHDYIVWMDSDTLIFNSDKKFETIINKCAKNKYIIACEDIGRNSMLNSGVIIFKCKSYVENLIIKWRDFDGDKTFLYASGGDQEILCNILKRSDGFGFNRKIFPMSEFNTEPRMVDDDTFILHFMAYPNELKFIFMRYFVSS